MKKLNIGIIAHVDAGKTTLTENILYLGGAINKVGRVDKGDTQTDSMDVERRRGISVKAAATSFFKDDIKFNIIDTPGHVDFVAEVERSLQVLDGVVLVISAKEGLQSQTRILMDAIMAQRMPAVIFINKIDRMGAGADKVADEACAYMGGRLVRTQKVGANNEITPFSDDEMMEQSGDALYMLDDDLMACFVNGEEITGPRFYNSLTRHTKQGQLYPVFFGSALHGIGVQWLLDQLPFYLPCSPNNNDAPLSGVVFKVQNIYKERLVYIRLFQGSLHLRQIVKYGSKGKEEKLTRIAGLENGKIVNRSTIEAGDIGILYIKDMKIGDILGDAWGAMRNMQLARPTLSVEVSPTLPEQARALYEALVVLADEDPMLDLSIGKKLAVRMFGEVQQEILKELLMERYGICTAFSKASTIYMETPTVSASSKALIYRSGTPFAAGAGLRIEPLARGSGLQYTSEISLGDLAKTFQNAVEEAVMETCKKGVYGWEITDVKIAFDYADYDSVMSTPSDFRNLIPLLLMEAFAAASMMLLEPYLHFELRAPAQSTSKALGDLQRMHAAIEQTTTLPDADDDFIRITGTIPADTCRDYGAKIGGYTEGRGVWVTKFQGYKDMPFDPTKVNEDEINLAANKALYLMYKSGAQ
ncbi:MAG: TetM/TetW/TetO/TetS family tetracycline resistance ribosomal protection protein [Defluviitaleaceae bacterium]|nr:TetM/TetW/TetO/TetS family tetracycline resistance ribosomal protection protein [Defluviitaleaceae bacterium]